MSTNIIEVILEGWSAIKYECEMQFIIMLCIVKVMSQG